jgi:hypothetical protein
MVKLGVTGTRQFCDTEWIEKQILTHFKVEDISCIISGGAHGVDSCCEIFAMKHHIPVSLHKPDYDQFGKGAPLVRNREIVAECDELIGFPLPEKESHGTEFTIAEARRQGKKVTVCEVPWNK